jgi:GDP-L-fucose synthase
MVINKVLVTGGTGMVGKSFCDVGNNYDFDLVGSTDYDLLNISEADAMIEDCKPDAIIHLAARVGGVHSNSAYIADFFKDNILMNTNLLDSARRHGVKKVVSLLSTCVYPDSAKYPLTPEQFNDGPPHSSNFGYAYAKRMVDVYSRALRQQYGCNFICAVPNNLYGLYDNFHLEDGHVIPAIIRKVHNAKITGDIPVFWGSGVNLREFTFASDISKILLFLMENYNDALPVNIGTTEERTIKSVVELICKFMDYSGDVVWDTDRPSGQHRKPSCNKKLLELGWSKDDYTDFSEGLKMTCEWYTQNFPNVRGVE